MCTNNEIKVKKVLEIFEMHSKHISFNSNRSSGMGTVRFYWFHFALTDKNFMNLNQLEFVIFAFHHDEIF